MRHLNLKLGCAAGLLLLAGAAIADTDEEFGDSVNHMIRQQMYDPVAPREPATEPPAGIDGEKAAAALKAYRTEKSSKATREMQIVPILTQ